MSMHAKRNDKLLDVAICERCEFLPAQYEVEERSDCPHAAPVRVQYMCEGCVVAAQYPIKASASAGT